MLFIATTDKYWNPLHCQVATGDERLKQLTIALDDDLYRYLSFLERRKLIRSKDQAVVSSLEFYKMLAMHEWLPYVYRLGGGRVILVDASALKDVFQAMTDEEMYNVAKMAAFKRKLTSPMLQNVDLSNPDNWPLILREMELMGWGKFTKVRSEIKVELCALPLPYVLGYTETMFGTSFRHHRTKISDVNVLVAEGKKRLEFY